MTDDIDWSHWHKLEPLPGVGRAVAAASIRAQGKQRLAVTFNTQLMRQLAWGAVDQPWPCQVFEGTGRELGWLLLRHSADGPYKLHPAWGGRVGRLFGLYFEWAPDQQIAAEPVKFKILKDRQALTIQLPSWFDRELFAEAERREGPPPVKPAPVGRRFALRP